MLEKIFAAIARFFKETIWLERAGARTVRRFLIRMLQALFLVGKGFRTDKGFLRASALAYTTLLSIVPLLAFGFSILKGLGAEEELRTYFGLEKQAEAGPAEETAPGAGAPSLAVGSDSPAFSGFAGEGGDAAAPGAELIRRITGGRPEVAARIIDYISKTDFTALGVFGLVFLLWTLIKVLSTIEETFDDIWGVSQGRGFLRKVADYTSVMVIVPVLLVTAAGVLTYVTPLGQARSSEVAAVAEDAAPEAAEPAQNPVGVILGWTSAPLLIWAAFASLYAFMPNTRVRFLAAVTGGLVGGTLWQLAFWGYTAFNVGVARSNAIYGSFAALPIFLVWLYVSWVIVIVGAEVAYAQEHLESYRQSLSRLTPSIEGRELLALRAFIEIAGDFRKGLAGPTTDGLAASVSVPARTLQEVLAVLEEAGLAVTAEHEKKRIWLPGRDIAAIAPRDLLTAVRTAGDKLKIAPDDGAWKQAVGLHEAMKAACTQAGLDRSFAELLGSFE